MNMRKILIPGFVVLLIGSVLYIFFKPSKMAILCKAPWCVNSIYYKGRLIQPKTLHAIYMVRGDGKRPCLENISFDKSGDAELPGINSRVIAGDWQLDSNKNLQLNVDTLQYIFQGTYNVTIVDNKLVLKSKTTVIDANR